ncbi:MAG: hypothetical protein K8S55_07485 [Phycisphaerae bacterium]|nr:hypothetical protein [Phycisphaerae bacterium]
MTTETNTSAEATNAAADAADAEKAAPKTKPRWSWKKRIVFILYLLVLLEISSRVYWKIKRDVPFFAGPNGWYGRFYEELKESNVLAADLRADNEHFDVLLLGGSALDRVHTSLAKDTPAIQSALEKITGRDVRIFNLAQPAMSTRDSLIKYRLMDKEDKHFDLVVVYHGINDIRLNNCPPEKFKDDYTHAGFYKQLLRMEDQIGLLPYFTLPYTIEYTIIHIMSSKKFEFYVPRHKLNPHWLEHGSEIKTAGPFRKNLQDILDLAARRDEPVLLMTFAWYIPEGYSLEKLRAGKLDYAAKGRPDGVENWGKPVNVAKGLKVHNDIIRDLGRNNPRAIFVDAATLLPKKGEYHNDVCHLSEAGKQKLMTIFMPAIKASLKNSPDNKKTD